MNDIHHSTIIDTIFVETVMVVVVTEGTTERTTVVTTVGTTVVSPKVVTATAGHGGHFKRFRLALYQDFNFRRIIIAKTMLGLVAKCQR